MTAISLDEGQVRLLLAVDRGEVHHDPRYIKPDFRADPDHPGLTLRATRDLAPLKRLGLVELVDEADRYGVRLYKLTGRGELLRDRFAEEYDAARADPESAAPETTKPSRGRARTRAIRAHMAATGRPYAAAARQIDAAGTDRG